MFSKQISCKIGILFDNKQGVLFPNLMFSKSEEASNAQSPLSIP